MRNSVFPLDQLIVSYAPPNLRSVMPGNRVMLRSGGPEMTVCDTDDQGRAVVHWEDGDGRLQRHAFDLEMLTCYGAR